MLFSNVGLVVLVARTAFTQIVAPTLNLNFSPIFERNLRSTKRELPPFALNQTVIERMNRTLLNMLAKCIEEDQTNWSVKLPYVLMAYRSSLHESTGFTPHYLVFGHEISLLLNLMYRPPPSMTATDVLYWVS